MPKASRSLAEKLHGAVDRMVAALREQRAIEARRVLRSYHHLLHAPGATSSLNAFISVRNEEENAHRSDTRERAALRPGLERA